MFLSTLFRKKLLLFLFPSAFLALQILLKTDYKYFFLSSHDPAYGYLFNGLNLAMGNLELGLTAHPGTSLHCLVALNIFIMRVFWGITLPDSVIHHPECFLNIISIEIIALNTLALLLLGAVILKKTGKIDLSLAMQLTPFVSFQGISFASMVMLEPLLLCIEIAILLFLSGVAFSGNEKLSGREVAIIAILMGLGIATKIVFLPVLFLPVFLLGGIRRKLSYIGILIISFLFFLLPVYKVLPSFVNWVHDLFIHTGIYGSGARGFIDPGKFLQNLGSIFCANYLFTLVFLLTAFVSLFGCFGRFRGKTDPKKYKILAGLGIVFLLNILMVAKHYSGHYLIISQNLTIFGLVLIVSAFSDLNLFPTAFIKNKAQGILIPLVMGLFLLGFLVFRIHFSPALKNPRLKSLDFVHITVGETQRIVVLETPGPFIETGLFHGYAFSGGMKPVYAGVLKNNFPSSYFYSISEDRFFDWKTDFNLAEILSRSKRTFLYYSSKKDTLPPVLLERFNALIRMKFPIALKTSFRNEDTHEFIYEITTDEAKIAERISRKEVAFCTFEEVSPGTGSFISSDTLIRVAKGNLRSREKSVSGMYSMKLDGQNPFGADIKFRAAKGYYKIAVMRHSGDGKGLIVASASGGHPIYRTSMGSLAAAAGWEKLELTLDIPEKNAGQEISIYCWYEGKGSCYFDDLEIAWFEVN